MSQSTYRSQSAAIEDIVRFMWGTEALILREVTYKSTVSGQTPCLDVTADVNGHLVVFRMDNFGRVTEKKVVA